ncbi:glycosyltransferase family 9 protein [Achromobacter xylosoxidans]|uniref:Glycosyl transferase n=2 Tax=Alcaligenaceae TaxID=506 RepID=A0A424W5D2_ALCXX|nr:glycosyltransferase family 9 protein [Achromobacter xylosoxidans]MBD0872370.1 glycosyltransferase family 9 protein [Achromobacter xylosoxidans]QNP89017.1 glycosyltransferase family 9 protein [Achromobacter xylosoxidans]RPJ88506.1 glycosyl transferase [Achromobacter xylosoxidans]
MPAASSVSRSTARNCAIYISGGIGDGVLSMVFVRALAEQAGGTVSLLMTQNESAQELFRAQPYVKEVISLRSENRLRGWERITRVKQILADRAYDSLFLFTFRTHIALAARLAGIPQRIGFVRMHQPHLAALLTHRIWVRRKGTPHPDIYTWLPLLYAKAGYQFEPRYPSLFCTDSASSKAMQFCHAQSRTIGFGLNGSIPCKRYSGRAFAQVARILHARDGGLRFVLVGGSDVQDIAQEIRSLLPESITLLDATQQAKDICDSQALIASCSVFVSNDSMGMHIAAAHGIPTIGLFGATPALRYVPWLYPVEATVKGDMATIAPQTVAEAIWKHLATTDSHGAAAPAGRCSPQL